MKHERAFPGWKQSCYDDDWMEPDPYTVMPGFKQLPIYRCDNCQDKNPTVTDRYMFDEWSGKHQAQMLCDECWRKLR